MHISVSSDDDGVDTITAYGSKKDREDSSPEPLCVKPAEIHVCPMDATDCDCPEEQERLNREAFDAVGTWGNPLVNSLQVLRL
jgi:hypothetical protein